MEKFEWNKVSEKVETHITIQLKSIDRDFRYMALSDLIKALELQSDFFTTEFKHKSEMVAAIIKLFNDSNSEIQNLSMKR